MFYDGGVEVQALPSEKKFGNRIIRYTLQVPYDRTPGVYDLPIKATVPTSIIGSFTNTITLRFELTRNC